MLVDVDVELRDGRIARIAPAPRGRRHAAPPIAILPPLVDAHVHLQLGAATGRARQFVPWIDEVLATRATEGPDVWRARAQASLFGLLNEGTLAVGEIDASGVSPDVLRTLPMRGRCYQEVVGYDADPVSAEAIVARRARAGSRDCPGGLSPHAPYSVSPALFTAAHAHGRPLAIHVAETPEEIEFVARGRGPFRQLLERLGKWRAWRRSGGSPIRLLDQLGLLGPRTQLVHAQHLLPGDAERIRKRRSPIVVCPGTIRWFRREPPPVHEWLARGIPVALGTDSAASNDGVSMRAELRVAQRLWPRIPPQVLLWMATGAGATALASERLGRLRVGASADLLVVALPRPMSPSAFAATFVAGDLPVAEVLVRGRRWLPPAPRRR